MASKRLRARALGLCYRCCKNRPGEGKSNCDLCNEASVKRKQRERKRRREAYKVLEIVSHKHGRQHRLHEDAAQHYLDALNVEGIAVPHNDTTSTASVKALLNAAQQLADAGDSLHAVKVLRAAYAAAIKISDLDLAAEILESLCKQLSVMRDFRGAVKYARLLLKLPLPVSSIWLMRGYLRLARSLTFVGKPLEALDVLEVATKRCEYMTVEALCRYLEARALGEQFSGMKGPSLRDYGLAAELAQTASDGLTHILILNNFAVACTRFGELRMAKELHSRALLLSENMPPGWLSRFVKASLVTTLMLSGELKQAGELLAGLANAVAQSESLEFSYASVRSRLRLLTSEDAAITCDQESLERALLSSDSYRISTIGGIQCDVLQRTKGVEAHAILSQILQQATVSLFFDTDCLWLAAHIARTGRLPHCMRVTELLGRVDSDPVTAGVVLLMEARIARLRHDEELVALHGGRAEALFRNAGLRYLEAVAMEVGGRLRSACDAYDAMGAADAERLRPAVRKEIRPHLTLRQEQVVGLVVQDLSLAQVAERLNISFKTAEHHLTLAMQALGVNKREDLKHSPYASYLRTGA